MNAAAKFFRDHDGVRVVNGKPQTAVTHGTCKLVPCPDTAILWIRPAKGGWQDYWVNKTINDQGKITAFRLELLTGHVEDRPTVYTIDTSFGGGSRFWFCDCPDAMYRKRQGTGQCKHCNALAAAMAKPDELVEF